MSMFSTHYLIKSHELGYWLGGNPDDPKSWDNGSRLYPEGWPVRFFGKSDAEKVCDGILKGYQTTIVEDE